MEEVGIPVISTLDTNFKRLQKLLSSCIMRTHTSTTTSSLLDTWLSYDSNAFCYLPPTWRNLLLIIRLLNLDELAQRMETFLSGVTDRKEQDSHSKMTGIDVEGEWVWFLHYNLNSMKCIVCYVTEDAGHSKQLQMRDEVIYKLKQEISLLKEEGESAVFVLKEKVAFLTAEIEQLQNQQLTSETGKSHNFCY